MCWNTDGRALRRCRSQACKIALGLLLVVSGGSTAVGQVSVSPRPGAWSTDGSVSCLAESCGVLFVGGSFTYVGPVTGRSALLSPSAAKALQPFPRLEGGTVDVVAADGAGGWYLGGNFMTVDGLPRSRLVHILSDQTVDTAWMPNPNAQVLAIAVEGNTVYVGGFFQTISGQPRNRLAAFDRATGQLRPWNPNANNGVRCLTAGDGVIYAGGDFTIIDGQTRRRIAAINRAATSPTTYLAPWNPDANNSVRTMALAAPLLYVGGDFSGAGSIGGQSRNRIAALRTSDASATAWNPNANAVVRTIGVVGDTVYVGGGFNQIGGLVRNGLAALQAGVDTNNATPWNPNPQPLGTVYCLSASSNTVYIGGDFTSVDGTPRNRIAALDAQAMANYATSWDPNADGRVSSLGVAGGAICVSGLFSTIGRVARNNLAAFDAATGEANAWNPNANGAVSSLAIGDNGIYAGGAFTQIGGQVRNQRMAALDPVSGTALGWNPLLVNVSQWQALKLVGGTLYAAGTFNSMTSQLQGRICAVDAGTGAVLWNYQGSGSNERCLALEVASGVVYVGGAFGVLNGQTRNNLAALDAANGGLLPWNPNADGIVHTLAAAGNQVFAGGEFSNIGGAARARISALDASSGAASNWNPGADNIVRALAVLGGTLYVGGDFLTLAGQSRQRIGAIGTSSGILSAWNPATDGSVAAWAVSGDSIYVGGSFTGIGGQPRKSLAVFTVTNSGWTGGPGVWSDELRWSPPRVPDNSNCDTFNVLITGATSNVTLNIDPRINSLNLASGATLNLSDGSLTLLTADGVTNDATLIVGPDRSLKAGAALTVGGMQPIRLAGLNAALSSETAEAIITLATDVVGEGVIDAAFVSKGRAIDANIAGGSLDILGAFPAASTGTLRATNGGELILNRSITGTSGFIASGGTIQIPGFTETTAAGSSLDVLDGGRAAIAGSARADIAGSTRLACSSQLRGCNPPVLTVSALAQLSVGGDLEIEQGAEGDFVDSCEVAVGRSVRLACSLGLRGCNPPVLNIQSNARVSVGGDFQLSGPISIQVGPSATVSLIGNFDNQSTSNTTFRWETGPLTLNGPAAQSFELAGRDFGDANPSGYVDNFAMGTLRVEPGRTVNFVNAFDNSPGPGCEVLYVDTLSLGAGCTINLNGCNVYYRRLIMELGATVNLNGGHLSSALIGDMNCDGAIGGQDVAAFVLAVTDPAGFAQAYPGCPITHADLNQSGAVEMDDVPAFVDYVLQTP